MTLLTDAEIRDALRDEAIEIKDFATDCLGPASYDLRLGREAVVTGALSLDQWHREADEDPIERIDVEKDEVRIPPGGFALVISREWIRLGPRHAGWLGFPSSLAREGLVLLSGPQVDPGFRGHIVVGFANLSPGDVYLRHEDRIVTVGIHLLNRAVEESYAGGAQDQSGVPNEDANHLRMNLNSLSVRALTKELAAQKKRVNSLETRVTVGLTLVIGLAVPVLVKAITEYF